MERKNNFNIYRFCFICLDYGQETFSNKSSWERGNNQIPRLKTIYKEFSSRLNRCFFLSHRSLLNSTHGSHFTDFKSAQPDGIIRSIRINLPFKVPFEKFPVISLKRQVGSQKGNKGRKAKDLCVTYLAQQNVADLRRRCRRRAAKGELKEEKSETIIMFECSNEILIHTSTDARSCESDFSSRPQGVVKGNEWTGEKSDKYWKTA